MTMARRRWRYGPCTRRRGSLTVSPELSRVSAHTSTRRRTSTLSEKTLTETGKRPNRLLLRASKDSNTIGMATRQGASCLEAMMVALLLTGNDKIEEAARPPLNRETFVRRQFVPSRQNSTASTSQCRARRPHLVARQQRHDVSPGGR